MPYRRRIVDEVRPDALRARLAAYGAATSTDTAHTKILNAATAGHDDKPGRGTVDSYREHLSRIFVLDPLPAWIPAFNPLKRLTHSLNMTWSTPPSPLVW